MLVQQELAEVAAVRELKMQQMGVMVDQES
jgi:hypothetical protein